LAKKLKYRIEVVGKRGLRQRWHVRVRFAENGEVLMVSEKYRHRSHALKVADDLSLALGAAEVVA
jgi:hypothetical protein